MMMARVATCKVMALQVARAAAALWGLGRRFLGPGQVVWGAGRF